MGVAPVTIAPSASALITAYDWRTAMLVIGIAAWALLIPASFLVRPAPKSADDAAASDQRRAADRMDRGAGVPHAAIRRRSRGAHFACCAAHSGPIFHMVSYAMVCGIAPLTAVTVYSLAGFSGLGGRLLLGTLADRLGAKPVLVGGLFVQAFCIATYLAVAHLGEFYALSVVFGLAYGGVMPLYAVLVREYLRRAHHGHGVRRGLGLCEPRHGARAMGRRLHLRHHPWLHLAARRFLRHWPCRGCRSP